MPSAPARLAIKSISRRFPGGAGVRGVTFDVAAGEVVCLLGPSGCGKSTTLRIAAGVERAESGDVEIDGATMQGARVWIPPERRHVGLMFQDYALFPHLSVLGNVMFGLDALPRKSREDIARRALAQVGLDHLARSYPDALSGGEQQRVALARALAPQPRLLLMDEPFSGLDERLREDVRERTMSALLDAGASALVVTHDPDEAMAIGDRIVLMRAGQIVQIATPAGIYAHPVDVQAAAFFSEHVKIESVVANGRVETVLGAVPTSLATTTRVDVLIRPDAVEWREGGVPAEIVKIRPAGAETVLTLKAGASDAPTILRARMRLDRPPPIGARMAIGLHPQRTLVLARK